MSMKMYTIWSNEPSDIENIRDDLREDYPDYTDDELWNLACETCAEFLEDERLNLNINVGDDIVVIGDLGLWHGRRSGYKLLRSQNIRDCFSGTCGDYVTWFVDDRGDMWCRDIHHDGTNLYLYRAWKPDVTEMQKYNFCEKLYHGTVTRKDITRYTRKIGTYVADVYGWKVNHK